MPSNTRWPWKDGADLSPHAVQAPSGLLCGVAIVATASGAALDVGQGRQQLLLCPKYSGQNSVLSFVPSRTISQNVSEARERLRLPAM